MKLNKFGFSLPQVLLAMALVGALSVYLVKMMENINNSFLNSESRAEYVDLEREIVATLSNEKHCRISVAGKKFDGTPALDSSNHQISEEKYSKGSIDNDGRWVEKIDTPNSSMEGIDFDVWMADSQGEKRVRKIVGVTDVATASKMSKIKIDAIKLTLPNAITVSGTERNFEDVGQLIILGERRVSRNTTFPFKILKNLFVRGHFTDATGNTNLTIDSCTLGVAENLGSSLASCSLDLSAYGRSIVELPKDTVVSYFLQGGGGGSISGDPPYILGSPGGIKTGVFSSNDYPKVRVIAGGGGSEGTPCCGGAGGAGYFGGGSGEYGLSFAGTGGGGGGSSALLEESEQLIAYAAGGDGASSSSSNFFGGRGGQLAGGDGYHPAANFQGSSYKGGDSYGGGACGACPKGGNVLMSGDVESSGYHSNWGGALGKSGGPRETRGGSAGKAILTFQSADCNVNVTQY